MTPLVLTYCAAMTVATAMASYWLRLRRDVSRLFGATTLVVASAAGFAVGLGDSFFAQANLLGVGLFGWLPAFLLLAAWLLRRARPDFALWAGVVAIAAGTVAIDAYWIEPHWLEVTHYGLESSELDEPLRVAVVADFQTDVLGDYELRSLERVMEERPDVILLAGDYLQPRSGQERFEALRDQLNAHLKRIGFSAPLGVYALKGNTDFAAWTSIFEGLPVTLFDDTRTVSNGRIAVTGLSVEDSFRRRLEVAPAEPFHIVLGHGPDYALGDIEADLLAAGHTHGGQVRIPGFGPPVTFSKVPRAWAAGVTHLPSGGALAVSRGLGMERGDAPRLRFLCRPELMILDIQPAPGGPRHEPRALSAR